MSWTAKNGSPTADAALLLAVTTTALLCAADAPSVAQPWGLIIPVICVMRRAHEIGGWLLFFHISNITSFVASLVMLAVEHSGLSPDAWDDGLSYGLFLADYVPAFVLMPVSIVVAELLRSGRNVRWLKPLRVVLWLRFAHCLFSFVIELTWFEPDATFILTVTSLLSTFAWALYFMFSKRVRSVYIDRDWPALPPPKKWTPPAPK